MADRYLNQFVARGTAADRAAFTPSEPAAITGPVHAYLWWETDTDDTYAWDGSTWRLQSSAKGGFSVTFVGGGAVLPTGVQFDIEMPCGGEFTAVRLLGDQTGSIVVDILKAAYASLPPASSICASALPTITTAIKSEDTTLTGWTTSFSAGDWLRFTISSVTAFTRVTLALRYTRT